MLDHSREVYWLEPSAWEHLRTIDVLQVFSLEDWLAIMRAYDYSVVLPAEVSAVTVGSGARGQVVAVETGSRQFFLVLDAALPSLADFLTPADGAGWAVRTVPPDEQGADE